MTLRSAFEINKAIGQSCAIAALSGSTNESYEEITSKGSGSSKTPTGSNSSGKQCITKYYKELGLKAPGGNLAPKGSGGDSRRYAEYDARKTRRTVQEKVVRGLEESGDWEMVRLGETTMEKRQGSCKPNALFFARGTTEIGTMGSTVGPALSSALTRLGGGKWKSEGVKYTADIAGDDCIGFPGGIKCRDQLEKMATACPETKWFLAGYSQGAMVARICTAYSKPEIKEKIKVRNLMGRNLAKIQLTCFRALLSLVTHLTAPLSKGSHKTESRRSARLLMVFARVNSRSRPDTWVTPWAQALLKQPNGWSQELDLEVFGEESNPCAIFRFYTRI